MKLKFDFDLGALCLFFLFSIILAALFSGCATQRRCNELYPPQPSINDSTVTVVKDSVVIVEKTVIRDSVVYVTIPGDSARAEVVTDDKKLVIAPVFAKTDYSFAWAFVSDGRLVLELFNYGLKIPFTVQSKDTEKEKLDKTKADNSHTGKERVVVRVNYMTKVQTWFYGTGILATIAIGIWLIIRLLWRLFPLKF